MKNILVVEDCPELIELYTGELRAAGYAVGVAEDGLLAMKTLHRLTPHLVVLDLMMPKFNGADVLKYIRNSARLKDIKVLVFSNHYMTDLATEAQKHRADAYIVKSTCRPGELVQLVKELLNESPQQLLLQPLNRSQAHV